MKVALESSSLFFKKYTGIPFYIHKLFSSLKGLNEVDPTLVFRLKKKWGNHTEFHKNLLNEKHAWHLGNRILSRSKFDISHSLHTPFLHCSSCLNIATIHDLAVHLPEFQNFNFSSTYFKKKRFSLFTEFAKSADAIIAVSETTKRDFLRFFDFPEERIHVVPLAPSHSLEKKQQLHSSVLEQLDLKPKTYFIAMGGVSLRKNTLNLIKAFHLSESKTNFKLIITGKIEAAHRDEVIQFVSINQLKSKIIFTDYLPDNDLQHLYNNAKAFLFPTFYEGFGIPILEAMMAQLPVLTSTTGAASETAGGFAVLVNPFEPESISQGIDRLENISLEHLEKARSYALSHTWDNTAKLTTAVYEKYM